MNVYWNFIGRLKLGSLIGWANEAFWLVPGQWVEIFLLVCFYVRTVKRFWFFQTFSNWCFFYKFIDQSESRNLKADLIEPETSDFVDRGFRSYQLSVFPAIDLMSIITFIGLIFCPVLLRTVLPALVHDAMVPWLVTDSTAHDDNTCHIGVRWVSLWCLFVTIQIKKSWEVNWSLKFILILIRPVLDRENRRILGVIYLLILNANRRPRPRDEFLYFFIFYAWLQAITLPLTLISEFSGSSPRATYGENPKPWLVESQLGLRK